MRDWQIRTNMLVLHGTDREIPGQRATIIDNPLHGQSGYMVAHYVGQKMYRKTSRPTLTGAIRLAEGWVR